MIKKYLTVTMLVVFLLCAAGCKNMISIPRPLISSETTYDTYEVATAIGPDGVKHFVWSECALNGSCHIVYTKTYLGESNPMFYYHPYSPNPEYPARFINPDIAVGGDGYVYLAWHYIEDDGSYYDCWNMITNDGTTADTCGILQTDFDEHSTQYGRPKVVAMDNVAYAAYEVRQETGDFLMYRKIRSYSMAEHLVSGATPNVSSDNPSIALSYDDASPTSYTLHITWSTLDGGAGSRTYYNDNYGVSGDMPEPMMSIVNLRSDPELLVATDTDRLYVAYFTHATDGSYDRLNIMDCAIDGCDSPIVNVTALDTSLDWELVGMPSLSTDGSQIYVAFNGTNITTRLGSSFPENFWGSYQTGSAPDPLENLTRLTNEGTTESPPVGVLGIVPVIGWREVTGSGYMGNAFMYELCPIFCPNTVKQVFSREYSTYAGNFDMAGDGNWVVGIWNSPLYAEHDRVVPWVSMNVEGYYQPLIKK